MVLSRYNVVKRDFLFVHSGCLVLCVLWRGLYILVGFHGEVFNIDLLVNYVMECIFRNFSVS